MRLYWTFMFSNVVVRLTLKKNETKKLLGQEKEEEEEEEAEKFVLPMGVNPWILELLFFRRGRRRLYFFALQERERVWRRARHTNPPRIKSGSGGRNFSLNGCLKQPDGSTKFKQRVIITPTPKLCSCKRPLFAQDKVSVFCQASVKTTYCCLSVVLHMEAAKEERIRAIRLKLPSWHGFSSSVASQNNTFGQLASVRMYSAEPSSRNNLQYC